ncbi:hypothetical protein ZOD2009_00225 [Haladaptatus paucihalophilus DX253]|uniref:Uncharacterized protein n=1 Tax=Haladaptatus paucihalophilus DX253 TaxID=797209 RepID=E7QMM9_HALPU|nr:hypothetical protein ZOD2009_00225 [Haladaptatus paucihalophilus DX253]SHL33871.1 hypothetical protein SAMN05444342_3574 [Haladaptatus paucihalophilus DX253]
MILVDIRRNCENRIFVNFWNERNQFKKNHDNLWYIVLRLSLGVVIEEDQNLGV